MTVTPTAKFTVMNHIKIMLNPDQAAQLDAVGEDVFMIVGRGSYPDSAGRWIIHCVPAESIGHVNRAAKVARGLLGTRKLPTK